MSEVTRDVAARPWALPPLVLHAERGERTLTWLDDLEALLTAWPMRQIPRILKPRVVSFVHEINGLEPELRVLSDTELAGRLDDLRIALRRSRNQGAVAKCFAHVRETARRELGLRHYDVQLQAGYALLHGQIAEMETGEGKTLAATLAAATAALAGEPVHVVTVNDYLAERDGRAMGPLYRAMGLTLGIVVHTSTQEARRQAYACDVVYVSNKELAFDYLRDRIALGGPPRSLRLKLERVARGSEALPRTVLRGLHFAIVDEADSVLIDEARTPLIISRSSDPEDEARWAQDAFTLADALEEGSHYRVVRDARRVDLTRPGRELLERLGEELGGVWMGVVRREEAARLALCARHLYQAGDHYLVRDGKIQIVDEYTGRIMEDRTWGEGLHQLIEWKEGCTVTGRNMPVARLTYQRLFRRYNRLAGLTGTAREVGTTLWRVYRLAVVRIPTNRPCRRRHLSACVLDDPSAKWELIVQRARALAGEGRSVLVGTRSVAASEALSERLGAAGVDHVVLNAAQDQHEAEIIACAGLPGRVTVATNMAGRGVDILLAADVAARGGLHVIVSELHDAGRIDRQLEGRCGRQGDPGSTEAILSLGDPLLELLPASNQRLLSLSRRWNGATSRWLRLWLFRRAQRRAERANARARKELMKADQRLGMLLAFAGVRE